MEKTPFDLNDAVKLWRQDLSGSPAITADNLDEMTTHLLDSISALEHQGLTPEEAFLIAQRRMGSPGTLENEFAKVRPAAMWQARCRWMLGGVVLYTVVMDLVSVLSGFIILLGNSFHLEANTLAWVALAGTGLLIGGVAIAFYALATGRWTPPGAWILRRCKPTTLADTAIGVLLVGKVAAMVVPLQMAYQLAPMRLGQIYMVAGWGNLTSSFLVTGLICLSLVWLTRQLSTRIPRVRACLEN